MIWGFLIDELEELEQQINYILLRLKNQENREKRSDEIFVSGRLL